MSEAAIPGGLRGRLGAVALLSDDRLARRAVQGDERAFAAIFDRYHQDLYRFCLAIAGNPADAQDALQNTMVKVLRALPGEQRRIELRPWLYRIAHNEAVELLRRRRPTEQLDPELAARGGSLAEDAEARDRLRRLFADLEQLPDRQRGALVMRELGGLGFGDIGAALGTSPATARQTLYEARRSLLQMEEGREMDCDAVTRVLSDADGRVSRRRDIRAHLRSCPDCRRFRDEIEGRRRDLGALAPLPAVAAAGLLQGLLGGGAAGAGAGAGLAGAAAGGAAKSLGAGAAIKSAAAAVAVAVVGAGAADRTGIVDVTPWGSSQQQAPAGRAGGDGTAPSGAAAAEPGAAAGAGSAASGTQAAPGGAGRSGKSASGATHEAGAPVKATAVAAPSPAAHPDSGATHPNGRGHEKQHPEAASHGQETAASHGAQGNGRGQGGGGSSAAAGEPPKQAGSAKAAEHSKPPKGAKPPKAARAPKKEQPPPRGEGEVAEPPKALGDAGAPPPSSLPPQAGEPKGKAKGHPAPSEIAAEGLDG